MQRRKGHHWATGVWLVLASTLTLTLNAQQPTGDTPLAVTSISTLQTPSTSKDAEVFIDSWFFLGPFADGNGVSAPVSNMHVGGLDYDYLAAAGHPEAQFDSDALAAVCKSGEGCMKHAASGPIINLLKLFPARPHTVLYAVAILDSATDGYVGLQYDVSFGTKIWVNGQLIDEYKASTRHPVSMYVHFVPIRVKKGSNLLLLKTDQGALGPLFEPWSLAASLMPLERMWDYTASTQDGFLLANRLLKPGDGIHIPLLDAPMKLDRSAPTSVSVMKPDGNTVSKIAIAKDDSGFITIPKLDPGYYKVRLDVGSHRIDDAFYIGDTNTFHDQLKAIQDKTPTGSDEFLQRGAILKRFEILTSQQYSNPTDANWQKKLMLAIEDGESSIAKPANPSWFALPGQHFRGFVSSADQSQQNYLLDIPENLAGNIGLVIVAPYAVSKQRPFLESSFISYSAVMEQIKQAANESKLAVAIIGGREPSGESPADEADALDILKDIESHYPIDPKRIYVYGVCEGGRNALLLAEHHPGIFAAVGAWGPTLAAARDEYYDPVLQAKQITNTPLVLFKGDLDNELPNSALQAFGRILKSLGNQQVTIQIVPNAMHDPMRMESVIFPLLARFTNDRPVGQTNLSASNRDSILFH